MSETDGMLKQISNESVDQRQKDTKEFVITDLLLELTKTLNEKAQLECENTLLKNEMSELKRQLKDLEHATNKEKVALLNDFNCYQREANNKDVCLSEEKANLLDEQKKYLLEIKDLHFTNSKLNETLLKREQKYFKELNYLDTAMTKAQYDYVELKNELGECYEKSNKYKEKLKNAIRIIYEQQNFIDKGKVQSKMCDEECQTDVNNFFRRTNSNTFNAAYELQKESNLLSQLYFSNMFNEVDSLLTDESSI